MVSSHKFLKGKSLYTLKNIVAFIFLWTVLSLESKVYSQQPTFAPPTNLIVKDTPDDAGGSIDVYWKKSMDDGGGSNSVTGYVILRSMDGEFEKIGEEPAGTEHFTDSKTVDGKKYFYKVYATDGKDKSESEVAGPVSSVSNWFYFGRINILVPLIIFSFVVFFFIMKAKKGAELFIRRISGLQAVDEAIGRATEMGKPVLFVPGIGDMSYLETIASMSILRRVARKTAEYETPLVIPNSDPIVFNVAQEIVRNSYLDAGRPDAYIGDNIRFLTSDQFGFAAGVDGIMNREKPGANFLLGWFMAESLILAETGYSTGAIQIAGTAQLPQLPFFVTACDYTLIGEELYAASAYLSREPMLVAAVKGQDWGKALIIFIIILGVVLETLGVTGLTKWFGIH